MHTAIDYLNEALELGGQEFLALTQERLEDAKTMAERRNWLISQAWSVRQGCDDAVYKSKLLQIQSMQHRLTTEATAQKQKVTQGLVRSRKENRRLVGYQKAMAGYGA